MAEQAKNPDELGALWLKTGAKGDYMTGTINGVAVVVFKNERKVEGSNQPDWRVLKSKPREQVAQPTRELNHDDIPF
jgi:predicted Rdx family selenoprotein